jgi:peptide/nickel transport system substrate-binding protein
VSIVPVPDANARLNGVLSGDIHLTSITPEQIPDVEGAAGMAVQQAPSNQTIFLSSNITQGFLADPDFRKAVSMAIDREALTTQLLGGAATPLGQTAPAVVTGHVEDIEAEAYDPDGAQALLEEIGYDGTPIPFEYPSDGNIVNSTLVAQAIAQQLGEVGIEVDLQGSDWASFLLDWNDKQMQGLYLFQFSPNAMDASSTLNLNFKSTGYVYWDDAELDALIAQAAATSDPDARLDVFADIWEYNLAQEYVINLYGSENVVAHPTWMDFDVRGDGQVYFVDATAVE